MRKDIGKKIRFEVFKRDSFTCQYCGAQAPNAVLHVDHIKPVSAGGDNEIFNLVTACVDCNSGKGPMELDDNSVVEKQRRQLEELNERRLQLEMMLEWRESLRALDDMQIDNFCEEFSRLCDGKIGVNENGRKDVKRWLKKHTLEELLTALDGSATSYLKRNLDGELDRESVSKTFNYVPRVAAVLKRGQSNEKRQFYYIRGILRNRVNVNERVIIPLLETAYVVGCDMDAIQEYATVAKNWTSFRAGVQQYIENLTRTDENEVSNEVS